MRTLKSNQEYWLPVTGYEGLYEVSNMGNIRSLAKVIPHGVYAGETRQIFGKLLSPVPNKNRQGYVYISLSKDKHKVNHLLHRLVAKAWLLNPNDYPQVNHKDFDTSNNKVTNLEWCTATENIQHAMPRRKDQRGVNGARVTAIDKDGNEFTFPSIRDAARVLNVHGQNICAVLKGKGKRAKGYTFKYAA